MWPYTTSEKVHRFLFGRTSLFLELKTELEEENLQRLRSFQMHFLQIFVIEIPLGLGGVYLRIKWHTIFDKDF